MQESVRSRRDVVAGAIFVVIAAGFAFEASNYDAGTALRMGPGFIPLFLAGALGLLGVVILVSGLRREEFVEVTPIPWRGLVLVTACLVLFGAGIRFLGLVPVVFVGAALTALASRRNGIGSALAIAACLSLLCVLIFKVGLRINTAEFSPALFGLANPISDTVFAAFAAIGL